MVKNITCACILLLTIVGCTTLQNSSPISGTSITIESITTSNDGLFSKTTSSSEETPDDCKEFKLSNDQINNFFSTATLISKRNYDHDLLPSRCYAEGKLQSTKTENGYWNIDRARRGLIKIENQEELYFFCNDCLDEVFYEACDLNCALDIN